MSVVGLVRKTASGPDTAEKGKASGGKSTHPKLTREEEQLLAQRYCLMLRCELEQENNDVRTQVAALKHLEKAMALVPAVDFVDDDGAQNPTSGPLYIDRFTVSNAEYAAFVAGGGYSRMELWPEAIWPNVLQFVDASGYPGPRYWRHGKPPKGRERHPVVGVCWYEARAYALWVGKRLPTGREWESASSWCCGVDGRKANRYPWGNSFDPKRANTWSAALGDTTAVDGYYDGSTPNGIHQLIGNVWEWVSTRFQLDANYEGYYVTFEEDMAEVRGGAFNTYFEEQATCQFRTGQPFLYRGDNVGFRCCVSASELKQPPEPNAFLDV